MRSPRCNQPDIFIVSAADQDPSAEGAVLDSTLAYFTENYGLASEIAEAYAANKTSLYLTGLPVTDPFFVSSFIADKFATLGSIDRTYSNIKEGRFLPDADSQTEREHQEMERIVAKVWDKGLDWDSGIQQMWAQAVTASEHLGLRRSRVLNAVLMNIYLHYLPPDTETGVDTDTVFNSLHDFIHPNGVNSEFDEQTGVRLRRLIPTDFTKSTLDARFENITKIAQVEIIKLFMDDVFDLGLMGGNRAKHALLLINRYIDCLFEDDLGAKQHMMLDLAQTIKQSAQTIQHRQLAGAVRKLGRRSSGVATHMDAVLQGFKNIYRHLGYKLPDLLREPEQLTVVGAVAVAKASLPTIRTQRKQKDHSDEMLTALAELINRGTELEVEARELFRPWRMTNKQRQKEGFGNLQRRLAPSSANKGPEKSDSKLQLPEMYRHEAFEILDMLAHLYRLARGKGGVPGARQAFHEVIEAQCTLEDRLNRLHADANQANLGARVHSIPSPQLPRLNAHIERVRDRWPAFSNLIIGDWPNCEGRQAANLVEQILTEIDSATYHG